tara:strand:+ start:510 stop:731 length:222 start_codon:yes stop_codon:yes gene_type:complete
LLKTESASGEIIHWPYFFTIPFPNVNGNHPIDALQYQLLRRNQPRNRFCEKDGIRRLMKLIQRRFSCIVPHHA